MLALFVAFLLSVCLVRAANVTYTVHAAVVFTRTGERTPRLARDTKQMELTSIGATQAYDAGSFFRKHYVTADDPTNALIAPAAIHGLSTSIIDDSQVYALASDHQFTGASAQAFMQGLYPPFSINKSSTEAPYLLPSSILSNGQYIEGPMNGYQYPTISLVSQYDPNSIYVSGHENCVQLGVSQAQYASSNFQARRIQDQYADLFLELGNVGMQGVVAQSAFNYYNSYLIYDYINYEYNHNVTLKNIIDESFGDEYSMLRYLADKQQWALYGDVGTSGYRTGDQIRTMAGKGLASSIYQLLLNNIASKGTANKLSLLFGDYEPLVSLFALLDLDPNNINFHGLPKWASSIVFELYSYEGSVDTYPGNTDLWVRFYFRNGTDDDAALTSYPIFNTGPSQTPMRWTDFARNMQSIMVEDAADWCNACGSYSVFCGTYNSSLSLGAKSGSSTHSGSGFINGGVNSGSLSSEVAGVIGAAVTLGTVMLLLAAAMLFFGVRFHRVPRSKKSELGGFKGGQKMASDQDLVLPKGGASVTVEPKERIGSWELKDGEVPSLKRPESVRQRSDFDEDAINPFETPVSPLERV